MTCLADASIIVHETRLSEGWATSAPICHGSSCWQSGRCTMRFGSTVKVLAECKIRYSRISECAGLSQPGTMLRCNMLPCQILRRRRKTFGPRASFSSADLSLRVGDSCAAMLQIPANHITASVGATMNILVSEDVVPVVGECSHAGRLVTTALHHTCHLMICGASSLTAEHLVLSKLGGELTHALPKAFGRLKAADVCRGGDAGAGEPR